MARPGSILMGLPQVTEPLAVALPVEDVRRIGVVDGHSAAHAHLFAVEGVVGDRLGQAEEGGGVEAAGEVGVDALIRKSPDLRAAGRDHLRIHPERPAHRQRRRPPPPP